MCTRGLRTRSSFLWTLSMTLPIPLFPRPVRQTRSALNRASGAGAVRGRLNSSVYKIVAARAIVHDQFLDELRETHAPAAHEILDRVSDRGMRFRATEKGGEFLELAERTLAIEDAARCLPRAKGLPFLGDRRGRLDCFGHDLRVAEGWSVQSQRIEDVGQGLSQAGKGRTLIAAMRRQRAVQPRHRVEAGLSVIDEIAN